MPRSLAPIRLTGALGLLCAGLLASGCAGRGSWRGKSPTAKPPGDITDFAELAKRPEDHQRPPRLEPATVDSQSDLTARLVSRDAVDADVDLETVDDAEKSSVRGDDLWAPVSWRSNLASSQSIGMQGENIEELPAAQPMVELVSPQELTSPRPQGVLLPEVIASVIANFPLVEAAYLERDRWAGEQLAARGAFDTKLKASSENQPLGFYETYRQSAGVTQPLYSGGEVFGGYRVGRGSFEPWYQERQTNDGGELTAGFLVPLARNREIDARRAELWRATYDRQIAEPEIRRELIGFVRDASVIYWEWVAAGQQLSIGRAALKLAEERNSGLVRQVEEGNLDPPVVKDNERAIAEREANLFERRRKFEQAAVKLSLFLRDGDAAPRIPPAEQLPSFPEISRFERERLQPLAQTALLRRPELESLNLQERRLRVDLAEGVNDLRPQIDAGVIGGQDMGAPTSSKRDKSEFELELGMYFELPVQRRKGYGKIRSARAKLAQLDAKRRFTANKIVADVQAAIAALDAASGRVERTQEAVALAEELAEIERIKFAAGESDLLSVFLREQFAIEAADDLVVALFSYHVAYADLMAALGNYQVEDWDQPLMVEETAGENAAENGRDNDGR